jgi:AmmeMemoRadiSam system protein A
MWGMCDEKPLRIAISHILRQTLKREIALQGKTTLRETLKMTEKYGELLKLARSAIESELNKEKLELNKEIKEKYSEIGASFVTLTEHKILRGCIGSLYPHQELYKDVIENAKHAAFDDYRFPQVKKSELSEIKIEISVLSVPKKLEFRNEKELLKKINKNMGIILKKGFSSATFLPQVWEEIPEKIDFLENLCVKAGIEKHLWKTSEIYFYRVEKLKER